MTADASPSTLRPRICMWSYHWPPEYSGAGLQARRLARALAARGWHVWALTSTGETGPVTETDDEGMRVVRVPRSRARHFKAVAAQTIWRYWRALGRRRRDFDLLHVHSAYLDAALGATLARRWGKACLVKNTLAGADLAHWGQGLWGKWQRWAFQSVGAFVGPSREAAGEFAAVGLPRRRVHHIPNGVDTAVFHPATPGERRSLRGKLGLPGEARLVLNLSALTPRKGTDLLVEAMGRVASRHSDVHLALVGPWERDGKPLEGATADWLPALRRRIAALGLEERVHIPGAQSNAPGWLRAADLFAFPAVNEGLPNAVLEAMATGLPMAAAAIAPLEGVAIDGENALLAVPGDAAALAAALDRLLSDAGLAARLGAAARRHVETSFSLDRVVGLYENLYGSLAAR